MTGETSRSELPRPDEGAGAGSVPVRQVLDPRAVRRAPRVGAFLGVGVVAGLIVGAVAGLVWLLGAGDASVKPGVTFTVILVTGGGVGALVAGFWAVIAERRSVRRTLRRRSA